MVRLVNLEMTVAPMSTIAATSPPNAIKTKPENNGPITTTYHRADASAIGAGTAWQQCALIVVA
jgi:hypothetical protein